MNYTNLSIDQAPPIGVPLRFFLTAPLFGMAAVLVMGIYGPDILQQRWLPQTIALTHLLTLGFITMTMLGALFQLLPVLAGAGIYKAAITSRLVHALFTLGTVLLSSGLYLGQALLIQLALFSLVPGLLLFLVSISISLFRSRSAHASVSGMRLSVISLWISMFLGLWLASGHAFDGVGLARHYTGLHLAWAAIGWVSIMIVSIAYQVVPMFQVTQEYPTQVKRYFSPLLFSLLLIWSLLQVAGYRSPWLDIVFMLCVSLLFILFISITLQLLMQRKKRLADASLYFWLLGLLMLPASLLIVFYAEVTQASASVLAAVIFIAGFILSVINAMLYKIVPFLVWLHLLQQNSSTHGRMAGIPSMNEIIPTRRAWRQLYLHAAGVVCLALAGFYPGLLFYPALLLLFINWLMLQVHLLQALKLYKRKLKEL